MHPFQILSAIFILLSFLSYASSFDGSDRTQAPYKGIVMSLLYAGLATFCKEQGITVVAVNLMYDFAVICQLDLLTFKDIMARRHVAEEVETDSGQSQQQKLKSKFASSL
jgi:hypothetical protein